VGQNIIGRHARSDLLSCIMAIGDMSERCWLPWWHVTEMLVDVV